MTALPSGRLPSWTCAVCDLGWVSGEALAAYVPNALAFTKLQTAARSARPCSRALVCPHCSTQSFRIVRVAEVDLDVCVTCTGVVVEPGEWTAVKSMRPGSSIHLPGTVVRTPGSQAVEIIGWMDALAQFLTLIH
jgi:hypothetical protein